jgi:hypothetical protein
VFVYSSQKFPFPFKEEYGEQQANDLTRFYLQNHQDLGARYDLGQLAGRPNHLHWRAMHDEHYKALQTQLAALGAEDM